MINFKHLLHYYPGRGKGKTTTALGAAMRAAGCGWKTLFIQFLKTSNRYGELEAVRGLGGLIEIKQMGHPCLHPDRNEPGFVCTGCMACHVDPANPDPAHGKYARTALDFACKNLEKPVYDLVVLDELGYTMELGLLSADEIAGVLSKKSKDVEVVVTGGKLVKEIAQIADYVTEITEIKHHFQLGIKEVKGIDY